MLNRVSSSFLNVDHSAIQTELKHILNTHKVKRYRNSDTKTRQQRTKTELPSWNGQ